jgi:hypothetical protein
VIFIINSNEVKAKNLLTERKQLMKTAGILLEYQHSVQSMDEVLDLLADLHDYMHDRADTDDDLGRSMNREGNLMMSIEQAEEFLKGLQA